MCITINLYKGMSKVKTEYVVSHHTS